MSLDRKLSPAEEREKIREECRSMWVYREGEEKLIRWKNLRPEERSEYNRLYPYDGCTYEECPWS